MSTSIRLSLVGKKKQPIYRIVVSETRYKRDGKHLEVLGIYDPGRQPTFLKLDQVALKKWLKRGAIISQGMRKLLKDIPVQ